MFENSIRLSSDLSIYRQITTNVISSHFEEKIKAIWAAAYLFRLNKNLYPFLLSCFSRKSVLNYLSNHTNKKREKRVLKERKTTIQPVLKLSLRAGWLCSTSNGHVCFLVPKPLVELHVKLLRKLGRSVTTDRWEKYLAKVRSFCLTWEKSTFLWMELTPHRKLQPCDFLNFFVL